MRILNSWLRRRIAFGLAIVLATPLAEATAASAQQTIGFQEAQSAPSLQSQAQDSDSRAGKTAPDTSKSDATLPDTPTPARSQSPAQSGESAATEPAAESQQETPTRPVGSAAAPYERTTGIAVSRPAGAVIAPARQRRARSILIRVSIVVGAAIAIGTVVALSQGSPSRPN